MSEIRFEPAKDRRLPGDPVPRCPHCRVGLRRAVIRLAPHRFDTLADKVIWKCDLDGWVTPNWVYPDDEEDE